MTITARELRKVIIKVAMEMYGTSPFGRRELMEAVEARVRQMGDWTSNDDELSGSVGIKSKGLAQIDWRITDLAQNGRLIHVDNDKWILPTR